MTKKLIDLIGQYSDVPAESKDEEMIRPVIESNMESYVDKMWHDKMGNLYCLRKGERSGRVMLCAHQDKVVYSNPKIWLYKRGQDYKAFGNEVISLMNKLVMKSPVAISMFDGESFVPINFDFSDKEKILSLKRKVSRLRRQNEEDFEVTSKHGRKVRYSFRSDRDFLMARRELDNLLEENVIITLPKDYPVRPRLVFQVWPEFGVSREGIIRGKLDDTLGLGIITRVNQTLPRESSPDLLTVFTVEEEVGGAGAEKAAEYLKNSGLVPDRCIVIDTTRFGELGEGAIIYRNCGGVIFDKRFVRDLEKTAKRSGIKYLSVNPQTTNDSSTLARGLGNVATIAIEVPITGMHSALETAHRDDVVATYKLVCDYLTGGNIKPLKGIDHAPKFFSRHKSLRDEKENWSLIHYYDEEPGLIERIINRIAGLDI